MQVKAVLLPSELDCQTVKQALKSGHYGCLKHICSATSGSHLDYGSYNEPCSLENIEHRSDKSCTALLQLLLSTCTDDQMKLYREGSNDMWYALLQSTVASPKAQIELCYSCLHVLLDNEIGRDAECSEMDGFVEQGLFDCTR